jgi:two-component system LytT family response regulator
LIKVLIIEDINDNLKIVDDILEPDKFEINYSHDKNDGVEIAFRYLPDLIIFLYTGNNDLDLLSGILKNEMTSSLPIITVSPNPSFEEQRLLMEAGVEDYIPLNLLTDSLLKSIQIRFRKISRIKEKLNEQINSFEEVKKLVKRDDHIIVKIGIKIKLIKFTDIICITALKEYSRIKTSENLDVIVRKSMRNWGKILPESSFLRIHRATIINLNYIDKIVQTSQRVYTVSLKGVNETFNFSYRYANVMRRTFPT